MKNRGAELFYVNPCFLSAKISEIIYPYKELPHHEHPVVLSFRGQEEHIAMFFEASHELEKADFRPLDDYGYN